MAARERHDALIRKCLKKKPAGSPVETVSDARSTVERATVLHDYETLRVFLEAGFPADATVGVKSTLFPGFLGLEPCKIISAPLLLTAFYPEARPTLLMNEREARDNQVNVIRLLIIHGASIDQTVSRGGSVFDFMIAINSDIPHADSSPGPSLRHAVLEMLLRQEQLLPSHFVKLIASYGAGYIRGDGYYDDGDIDILEQFVVRDIVTGRDFESWARGGRGVDNFPWEYFGLALLHSCDLRKIVFCTVNTIELHDSKLAIVRLVANSIVWQCNFGRIKGHTVGPAVYDILESCVSIDHTMPRQFYYFNSGMRTERYRLFEWMVLYAKKHRDGDSIGPITLDSLRRFFSRHRRGTKNLFVPAFVASHCGALMMRELNILYDCVEWGDHPDIMRREQRTLAAYLFSLAIRWEHHPDQQYRGSNESNRKSMHAFWMAISVAHKDNPTAVQLPVEIISRISMFFLIGTFGFAMHLICPRVGRE